MDVRDILDLKGNAVITVAVGATASDAAKMLAQNYIGAVVIADPDGNIAGILSERDISIGLSDHGKDVADILVDDIMTKSVVTCDIDDSIVEVLSLMDTHGIRHLPVIEDSRLVGVLSMRDVLNNWLSALETENEMLRRQLSDMTVAAEDEAKQKTA